MNKLKRIITLTVLSVLIALSIAPSLGNAYRVFADGDSRENAPSERGIFVTLSININGGDGQVWTTAKHDFSIFSSTVIIYVSLYCSSTFTLDYQNMDLVATAHSSDLNLGQTLTASASTGGEQMYWIGKMDYKIDEKAWETRVTGPVLCSATGSLISN